MSKLDVDNLTGVSETLLIPLHYRVEQSRATSGAFKDETAERFHDSIAYDWDKFQDHPFQRLGIVARTQILDREVEAFMETNPEGLVVNLGAGLDTRFYRLDNGTISWIEIDLPEVIAFRQQLRERANPRHVLLAASVLNDDWVAKVKRHGAMPILFIAEGLFPYFTKAQHELVFAYLANNFPGQAMLFQTHAPSALQGFAQFSALGKLRTNATMQWGLEEGSDVSSLHPKARFLGEFSLLERHEDLLPEVVRQRHSPEMIRKAAKIVRVQFE
jgi:O-methyltransferase involved in polyketide biosynthesis